MHVSPLHATYSSWAVALFFHLSMYPSNKQYSYRTVEHPFRFGDGRLLLKSSVVTSSNKQGRLRVGHIKLERDLCISFVLGMS